MAHALVDWPSAPLTDRLVKRSLAALSPPPAVSSAAPTAFSKLIQWSTYDALDHEATHAHAETVLASSFVIRKALIRKHFLARCVHTYLAKHPASALRAGVPRTWDVELAFADELDEKWADELWELGVALDADADAGWWILKPGMADRGMGIRLFDSKEALAEIFEEFEEDDDEDAEDDADPLRDDTAVITSQLRHFVIQEYVPDPLLLDSRQVPIDGATAPRAPAALRGHKFHLRAYCFASGALEVYLYTRILALFAAAPYAPPTPGTARDLAPHLTNTSLQTDHGEEGVRLLSELAGCRILSKSSSVGAGSPAEAEDQTYQTLTAEDIESIMEQMSAILADTFKAALEMPVHFQPLPNAFELYGVDFLVSHDMRVQLLEINAEPAIELTGSRLTWVLEDLFSAIGQVCVQPFLDRSGALPLSEAEVEDGGLWLSGDKLAVRKILDVEVRGSRSW